MKSIIPIILIVLFIPFGCGKIQKNQISQNTNLEKAMEETDNATETIADFTGGKVKSSTDEKTSTGVASYSESVQGKHDPLKISNTEKNILITIEDLNDYGIKYAEEYKGDFSKSIASHKEIEYEYVSPDLAEVTSLAMLSKAEFYKTLNQAEEAWNYGVSEMKTATLLEKSKLEEHPDFIDLGDQTYFANIIKKNDNIGGNYIIVRRGHGVYSFLIVNFYFNDPVQASLLLSPKLKLMDEYQSQILPTN